MNALKKQNDDKLLVTYVDLLLVLLVASMFFLFSLSVSLSLALCRYHCMKMNKLVKNLVEI